MIGTFSTNTCPRRSTYVQPPSIQACARPYLLKERQVILNDSSLSADVLNRATWNSDEVRIGCAVSVMDVLCFGPILINRCCEEYDQADLRTGPHVLPLAGRM